MSSRNIILVTGGNAGIGYELVRQLIADKSRHVLLGSRSLEKGEKAVQELQSQNPSGTVELIQLDVSSPESIAAAAEKVSQDHGHLDALVNNAAVASFPDEMPIHEQMAKSFKTNVIGVQLMGDAFGPLLEKASGSAKIVNVSSGAGSITSRLNPASPVYQMAAPAYRSSKAAMNMITANQSVEFGDKGMKVFAFCPGFTVSNLSDMNKAENGAKPTSEGAKPIVDILEGKRDEEHGCFLHSTGQYGW